MKETPDHFRTYFGRNSLIYESKPLEEHVLKLFWYKLRGPELERNSKIIHWYKISNLYFITIIM